MSVKTRNLWRVTFTVEGHGEKVSETIHVSTETGNVDEATEVSREVIYDLFDNTPWLTTNITSLLIEEAGVVCSIRKR